MSNLIDINESTKGTMVKIRDFLGAVIACDSAAAVNYMPPIFDRNLRVFCLGVALGASVGVIYHNFEKWIADAYYIKRDDEQHRAFSDFLDEIESGGTFATLHVFLIMT